MALGALTVTVVLAVGCGLWYINSNRTAIINQKLLPYAEEPASQKLGVTVKIGSAEVCNLHFPTEPKRS